MERKVGLFFKSLDYLDAGRHTQAVRLFLHSGHHEEGATALIASGAVSHAYSLFVKSGKSEVETARQIRKITARKFSGNKFIFKKALEFAVQIEP